jgi:hypothetical protein
MLTAVQSLYDEVLLQVKVGGERSAPFSSQQGVKQGDPSSPTLFGLFIEVLHEMLAAECAGTGPTIAGIGTLVETLDLIYADDVILLATSAASLQRQLRTLEQFCVLFEMKVNLLKTDVIVFRSAYNSRVVIPNGGWLLDGQAIRVVDRVTYLGVEFHAWLGLKPWNTRLGASTHRACMALVTRCREHRISVPEMLVRLYDTLVRPIASYGCPVWAPGNMHFDASRPNKVFNRFDQTMFIFLRYVSGCSRMTPRWILLHEHSVVPIQAHWARLTARWWRRMVGNTGWLAHAALQESIALSRGGADKKFWYGRFASDMRSLGFQAGGNVEAALGFAYDEGPLVEAINTFHDTVWVSPRLGHPRLSNGENSQLCRYIKWFYDGTFGVHVPHPTRHTRTFAAHLRSTEIPPSRYRVLARLRAGCWPIAVNSGRFDGIERSQRFCEYCVATGHEHVEDEMHVVMECPKFSGIRARFGQLFPDGADINRVVNHADQRQVAEFAFAVHELRFREL